MENIIKDSKLQHIVKKCLMSLDIRSISQFRIINQDCRRITDCPSFYLKKLSQQDHNSQDQIESWRILVQKIPQQKNPSAAANDGSERIHQNEENYFDEHAYALPEKRRRCEEEEEKSGYKDIKLGIAMELFKMYGKGCIQSPLELAQDLAIEIKKDMAIGKITESCVDLIIMFILEHSHPKSSVKHITKDNWDFGNLTPIHLAAAFGYVQVAKKMISNMIRNSIPPNTANDKGVTPTVVASYNNEPQMVKLLMAMASPDNPNVPDNDVATPMHMAAWQGHLEVVKVLMTSAKNLNTQASDGTTPIQLAASNGNITLTLG